MSVIEDIVRSRIREKGRVTFAEFMEMALYYPGLGYYTSGQTRVGAAGDFFTSPDTHPVFAALIALQLEQMWHLLGEPAPFTVVEMGAGKGLLARDIISYLPHLSPGFADSLAYVAKERENVSVLKGDLSDSWPPKRVTGCFLSNELLDAFPVHRVAMQGGRLQEVYITVEGDSFVEVFGEPSTPLLAERLSREGIVLADGAVTEVNLGIDPWMRDVADGLDRGFVVTIDYGYPAKELYAPGRGRGTLMTYYRHACGSDPYVRVGTQDITAHVDFTAEVRSGEERGLRCEALVSQRDFLLNLGHSVFVEALARKPLGQQAQMANRMSILELVREEGMGGFRVLVQSKGVEPGLPLRGVTPDVEWKRALRTRRDTLPVPLLDAAHMPLLQGKYPQYSAFDYSCE